MSLARKDFMRTTAAAIAPFALAFGLAGNPAAAMEPGCRPKAQINAELKAEQLPVVVKFFQGGTPDPRKPEVIDYNEHVFVMNTDTREGYRLQRSPTDPEGRLCVESKIYGGQTYDNAKLDPRAFVGSRGNTTDADKIIYGESRKNGENPIFKAREVDFFSRVDKLTIVLANPSNGGRGSVVSATHDGAYIPKYSTYIPQKGETPQVTHGAELTQTGKILAEMPAPSVGPIASLK